MRPNVVRQYRTQPEEVLAAQLTAENARIVAKWCHAAVLSDPTLEGDPVEAIRLPTLNGNVDVQLGEYVTQDAHTGYFSKMEETDFKAKFHIMGQRGPGLGSEIHSFKDG